MQEFYANLAASVVKKVRVRGVLVDFNAKSVNEFYNLESVNSEAYDRPQENPNFLEVFSILTNGQGDWKVKNEGHTMHFKAKHLA